MTKAWLGSKKRAPYRGLAALDAEAPPAAWETTPLDTPASWVLDAIQARVACRGGSILDAVQARVACRPDMPLTRFRVSDMSGSLLCEGATPPDAPASWVMDAVQARHGNFPRGLLLPGVMSTEMRSTPWPYCPDLMVMRPALLVCGRQTVMPWWPMSRLAPPGATVELWAVAALPHRLWLGVVRMARCVARARRISKEASRLRTFPRYIVGRPRAAGLCMPKGNRGVVGAEKVARGLARKHAFTAAWQSLVGTPSM